MTNPADVAFASSVTELGQVEVRDCADPECLAESGPGTAEPEQDGDHRYFICQVCGFEFGWDRMPTETLAVGQDGSCSVGVPEEVRKAASGLHDRAQAQIDRQQSAPVNLGLKIGKRPGL